MSEKQAVNIYETLLRIWCKQHGQELTSVQIIKKEDANAS